MKAKIIELMAGALLTSIVAVTGQTNQQIQTNDASYKAAVEKFNKSNWFFYGASSNGLVCGLWITRERFNSAAPIPTCLVLVTNQTTNEFSFAYLSMPATNLFSIEMFDSNGKPVVKTPLGKMFGLPLTQKQISDWFNDKHWQIIRHGRAWGIDPLSEEQTRSFSIPEAFEIKEAGEYTLHVHMRLIGNGPDASGQFPITWLPKAVAKVQIRPEDIQKPNQ